MRRITLFSLALLMVTLVPIVAVAATPIPNSAVISERVFNDCPFTTVSSVNNYPALVSIEDVGLECSGFANLHLWSLSTDGTTQASFENNSDFRFSTDLVISGSGHGESGVRITPWWSNTDGRFNVRTTDGEIACFGGRLPFFSFTGTYGLHYVKGDPIHMVVTYKPHGLNGSSPAIIEYELTYQGQTYSSGGLAFDQGNASEDPPHGLWGVLDNVHIGGYSQNFMNPADPTSSVKVTYTNIELVVAPLEPDADLATVTPRVFNDCPFTTLTVNNNYPSLISFNDGPLECSGFANLHVWTVSDDGRVGHRIDNDQDFRIASDFSISGPGEGGLRVSPWWSKDADGLFNVRSTDGEIAVFGGRLPFYSFTAQNNNLRYTAGDVVRLEMIYMHNGLSQADPGRIIYNLDYNGTHYSSGPLPFDQANAGEDPPHGLWGILNDARAGGHMKAFLFTNQPEAFTTGTWSDNEFQPAIRVAVKITPSSLNPNGGGQFVSAVLEPPAGYDAADIVVSSVRLNGQLSVSGAPVLGDDNENGIPDLKVTFNRAAATTSIGAAGIAAVTGDIGDVFFVGSDHVKTVKVKSPAAGAFVDPGAVVDVTWDIPSGLESASASVYSSLDDGMSWTLAAQGLSNSGHYNWHTGSQPSASARVAVVLDAGSESVTGVSGQFTIASPVGVGDSDAISFALKGTSPNPAKGPFGVNFSLPDGKRATLSVFDVSGRRVASREVGSLGAGRHTVTIGTRLKAGVYMIRLDREGVSLKTRAAVIQ